VRALQVTSKALIACGLLAIVAGGCSAVPPAKAGTPPDDEERYALWACRLGGTVQDHRAVRVAQTCDPLAHLTVRGDLSFRVLRTDRPAAYSFPGGAIYVSAGLVDLLDDSELAAVVAHEIGHLLADRHVQPLAALAGTGRSGEDVEQRADGIASQLLLRAGHPPSAMASALTKVAGSRLTSPRDRDALLRRTAYLSR
jgi:predicted Zn-dependent protease